MIQKHRISTNIGKDQKITVELKQDFDVLEILSLKFSQQEIYTSMCSDYGVVCGRITANDGFGIPNVRVSIFVKQKDSDVDDPVISKLYPYKDTTMRNDDNIRYNLLPKRQQHGGHTPVGTFPDQSDILTREEVLEVYESYYRFTVKTNESGDFMIWGVPVGEQSLHVDVDLSDIGCFSLRPYDFIKKGRGVDEFDRYYKFKSSTDIDGLPQIISYDKIIQVYPFWGNEEMCEIGISRSDFDISETGIKIEPISLILASSITDDDSDAVKRSGVIRRKTGYKCNLQTTTGKIECVRQTGRKVYGSNGVTLYPELQYYNITETINENGTAMVVLPMNLEYVYTNEFGEQELTNDTNKGIPTTAVARFRFSLDTNGVKTGTANYLIPQIREYNKNPDGSNNFGEYDEELLTTYQFSNVFEDYLHIVPPSGMTTSDMSSTYVNDKLAAMLGTNNEGIPEDVFYKFIFGKVYAPTSFQSSHYEVSAVESFLGLSRRDAFLGIKEIRPNVEDDCTSSTNYIPTNFAFRNRIKFGLIISEILLFLQYIFTVAYIWLVEIIGSTLWSVARFIGPINPPFGSYPFKEFAFSFVKLAYNICEAGQTTLPLTTYPDCEECTTDIDTVDPSNNSTFTIEEGCKKYDKFYNESIVYAYIWSNDGSYGQIDLPSNTGNKSGPIFVFENIRSTYNYTEINNPWFLLGKPYYPSTPNFKEQLESPGVGWTIVAAIVAAPGAVVKVDWYGTQYDVTTFNTPTRRLPNRVYNEAEVLNYSKKTKSGLTEIRDGVITIVPVVDGPSNSIAAIQEWYKRKRVGVFFCGGVTNYSFIDNWLHGVLYFFKFDKKIKWDNRTVRDLNQRGSKFPRELVFYNVLDEAFYYRSTPYNNITGSTTNATGSTFNFIGQKYFDSLEALKYREILRPTTFYDVGVRDEFLYEICQDPRIDPTCSVIRDITTTSYQDPANIVEHAINYRLDISDAKFDVDGFFTGRGLGDNVGVFDGDITQMMSINCEAGIEAFDLDSPQYFLYNGELMDPEDPYFLKYFKGSGGTINTEYGPLPIDLKLDINGAFIRQCLNFRLGDYSQKVPFFLWDKLGEGFGLYSGNYSDQQSWDRKEIASMKLQRLFSINDKSSSTSNYVMKDGEEEYLLKPMTIDHKTLAFTGNTTNALERYEVISLSAPTGQTSDLFTYSGATDYVEGDLWLHVQSGYTVDTSLWVKDPASGTTYVVVYTGGTQQWLRQDTDVNGQSVAYVKDYRESFIYQTVKNYNGTKQVLSTPFLFYFGLRPQNSAVDLLIKYYGPKGAFPSAE